MFFPVVSHSSVLPYAVPPVLHRSSPSLWSQGISREAQEVEVEGLEEGAAKDQQQRDADGHRGAMDIHTGGLDSFHPGAVAVDIHFAGLDKVAQTSFLCDLRGMPMDSVGCWVLLGHLPQAIGVPVPVVGT